MKKKKIFSALVALLLVSVLCLSVFIGCATGSDGNGNDTTGNTSSDTNTDKTDYDEVDSEPDDSAFENVEEATGDFTVTTDVSDGYTVSGTTYTFTAAGEYTLSGSLNGQILVNAGDDDEVDLVLNGVTVTNDSDSPIKITNADSVKIKVQKDTSNVINDDRSERTSSTSDDNDAGSGAIYAKVDLKIAGKGVLVVNANYNNGIHTTKDLEIKNASVKVTAVNNALKGNDSVTVESGNIFAISTKGDGIKTTDTDVSNKGNQRGTVTLTGGTFNIYAAGDGIQAAYDFVMKQGEDATLVPVLNIYTGKYSDYTASSASTTSYKGVKVGNELNVSYGKITLKTYDDGLHADYGNTLDNDSKGKGNINISGGSITAAVYSTTNSNSGGFVGGGKSGGWGGQQSVSGADGIHADNTLTISGGTVNIDSAYEGLEANHIVISGGTVTVFGYDDGVNASKKINETPTIVISGGKLDVSVGSGDVDGIDSNGSYTQTGGLVITRGAPSSSSTMATGLDCDGTATIKGGTFISFGPQETAPSKGTGVYSLSYGSSSGSSGGFGGRPGGNSNSGSSVTFAAGTWTLSGLDVSVTLTASYYGCYVYSNDLTKGTTYTMSNGTTTQSATAA